MQGAHTKIIAVESGQWLSLLDEGEKVYLKLTVAIYYCEFMTRKWHPMHHRRHSHILLFKSNFRDWKSLLSLSLQFYSSFTDFLTTLCRVSKRRKLVPHLPWY